MHILIAVLHRPTKPTGVCRHAVNLANSLADLPEITQVTLVIGAWQRFYFETAFGISSPKIQIVDVAIQNRSSTRNLWFLFGLPKLVNQLSPDLVHLAFPLPFQRSRFSCPVVATIHDLYPYECPENFGQLQAGFNRFFLQQCMAQSDGLTCVSQETLKLLNVYFPNCDTDKTITVNYNSVDFGQVIPKSPQALINKTDTPFLLSIAQHRQNKNLNYLIQSYADLLRSGQLANETQLILVGSPGPETEKLQQQISTLQLQHSIHLLSSINDSELCWLYKHCKVYVVCSSTEGFCLPLAESLHMGCKVICSDIPILREIALSDCTYFDLAVDPINNLSRAIVETIAQPAQTIHRGTRFSKVSIAKQYVNFYLKVMALTAKNCLASMQ